MPFANNNHTNTRNAWLSPVLLLLVCIGLLANSVAINRHFLLCEDAVSIEMDFDGSEESEPDLDPDEDKAPHLLTTWNLGSSLSVTVCTTASQVLLQAQGTPPTPPPELV